MTTPARENLALLPDWTYPVVFIVNIFVWAVFLYGIYRRWRLWKRGKAEDVGDSIRTRIKLLVSLALGQKKIVRRAYAGTMHILMYTGFVALAVGTFLVFLEMDFLSRLNVRILAGNFYLAYELILDLLGVAFIVGVLLAIYRRAFIKPKYLRNERSDWFLLALLLLLGLQGFVLEGMRLAIRQPAWAEWSIVGYLISKGFVAVGFDDPTSLVLDVYVALWWFHTACAFIFGASIPYTKYFHFITSPANIFYESLKPLGQLPKPFDIDILMSGRAAEQRFGASSTVDLTWTQRLMVDSCTICGRCTSACPAWLTGKPLDPMRVLLDVRGAMEMEHVAAQSKSLPEVVGYEELWACTSCGACMQECPVNIRHVPLIMDLRRNFALERGLVPVEAQTALRNIETNFNPWGIGWDQRGKWAEGMGIKTLSEGAEDVEYLFWVGCAGSFDDRNRRVIQAFARLMQRAGVKFAILGNEEKCSGDPARRMGNEYLAQIMIKQNIGTLSKYGVKKIVTACPHCFNTLKNEYPDFGGDYEVLHHSELLHDLIRKGKLSLRGELNNFVAFHDPCYLARYNGIYGQPRNVLDGISGIHLVEMRACRERGLCCGAGGGRMWMEERTGERINHLRLKHAEEAKAEIVATACPYCLIMLDDAAKTLNKENMERADIAELVERVL